MTSDIGSMQVLARDHDIAKGCACMYYPEANVLLSHEVDAESRTPFFKGAVVKVEKI